MKKTVSLILILALMLGITSVLSGCRKRVSGGTEAAKLLLANERLDENVVNSKIDLGLDKITSSASVEQSMSFPVYYGNADSYNPKYKWSDFPASNDTLYQFDSFIINIENEAARVAEDIVNMKNNVGIVDKWVKIGREEHMLRVYESSDVLIVKGEYEDIHVYYRYTDESAENVYEMYSLMKYDDGTTGEIRTMFIPGERYEYHYINSNGFEDYVIIENSRGYWMCTRYGYYNDGISEHSSFTNIIIKDGFCYSASLDIRPDEYGETATLNTNDYSIVDIASGRELLTVGRQGSDSYNFIVPFSSIKSGLQFVGSDEAEVIENIPHGAIDYLRTDKGGYLASDVGTDSYYRFGGGHVSYDYGRERYVGELNFYPNGDGMSFDESVDSFAAYLDDIGLTLYRDVKELAGSFDHAFLLADNFGDTFEWNGYKMSSIENVRSAREVLKRDYNGAREEYERVKNNESADFKQKLANNVDFAPLGILGMGNNSYKDGVITLDEIRVQVNDTKLFESGEKYALRVALSLCDENGNPISVNTVPLASITDSSSSAVAFGTGAITLTASGSFALPKNLTQGDYALVVYGAIADSGIRVTEMVKVGAFSTYNEKLESAAMDIQITTVSDSLHVKYAIKNSHSIVISATKEVYTVAELERFANVEALKYGAPFSGARLEYMDGTSISADQSLGRGEYRMMCYLMTADGLAQSYIYLYVN